MATKNSGFFLQSNYGIKGNLEVVFPRKGGGLAYYSRENDDPGLTWQGPFLMYGSTEDVKAATLIESNSKRPGNLEVIASLGGRLRHSWRDNKSPWKWHAGAYLPGKSISSGPVAFIQSTNGIQGNFEVVAASTEGGLAHWWRNNDLVHIWFGPTRFGQGNVGGVALIQSNFGSPGNLEAVARMGDKLAHYWREGHGWHGPKVFAHGVTGQIAFIQSTRGVKGDFEVVAPLREGGIGHWWRDNDSSAHQWYGPIKFAAGTVSTVSLIQSDLRGADSLEAVAEVDGRLKHYWCEGESNREWHGPDNLPYLPVNPSSDGQHQILRFSPNIVAIHTALLKTGKVMSFSFEDYEFFRPASFVLDPANNSIQTPPESHHTFCSGHSFLSDGRLFVAGGHDMELKSLHTFDPDTQTWTYVGSMEHGRWYPTCTTMPDGRVLIISGTKGIGLEINPLSPVNNTYQYYDTETGITPEQPIPKPFSDHFPPGFSTIDLYPFVYVLPSGKVLVHSRNTTRLFNPNTGLWDPSQLRNVYPYSRTYKTMGTSLLLPLLPPDYNARVMVAGGSGADPETVLQDTPATDTVEILEPEAPLPAWRAIAPMNFARTMPQSVLLPDGKVFVAGGSAKGSRDGIEPVLPTEMFDPMAETWTVMSPMNVPRLYHTTALLLPDARVLIGGKDSLNNFPPYDYPEHRIEIFSPPYLFKGPRPVINLAPERVTYKESFTLQFSSESPIASVALIKTGTSTHSLNMDQRYVGLEIVKQAGDSLTLVAPPNANIAPPGYYMFFLINKDGVPSIAKFCLVK